MVRRAILGVLLATLALATTSAADAAPAHHTHGVKPKPKPKAHRKIVPVAPLTSESLGLGEVKLSTAKAGDAPAPAAPAPVAPIASPAPNTPAQGPSPVPSASPVAPVSVVGGPDRDRVLAPRSEPLRRFTVGVNPLPIVAGRYGLNVEVVPFRHHAVVASAFYQTFTPRVLEVLMPSPIDVSRGAEAKIGGELGYRFYSGRDGAHGLFAGVSGVAMPLALPRLTPDFRSEVVSFHAFGGAVDVGVQAITSWGFTIGGGLGAMVLAYDAPRSASPPPGAPTVNVAVPHVLPRLLLAAGWSF